MSLTAFPYHRPVTLREVLLILASFLSGSIPFGLLLTRAKGIDIRTVGSGNIGATNVGRALGKKYFILCLILDALKGLLPVLVAGWMLGALGKWIVPPAVSWIWLACTAAAVLGHVFCPWLKFKGGKGVATSLGALLGVFPVLTLAVFGSFVVWAITLKVAKYMSLASVAAAAALPFCVAGVFLLVHYRQHQASPDTVPLGDWPHTVFEHGLPFLVVSVVLGAVVIWAHRANMRRLRAGTEPRFGAKKVAP